MFGKRIISFSLLIFLVACGSGNPSINNLSINLNNNANLTNPNALMPSDDVTENNETVVFDINYTDEEHTLSAYERYIK